MRATDRDSLAARIRQIRSRALAREQPSGARAADSLDQGRIQALEARLSRLEQLVEGLQDSVHRESERHSKMINDLQEQVRPETMSASLAEDARNRGL